MKASGFEGKEWEQEESGWTTMCGQQREERVEEESE